MKQQAWPCDGGAKFGTATKLVQESSSGHVSTMLQEDGAVYKSDKMGITIIVLEAMFGEARGGSMKNIELPGGSRR